MVERDDLECLLTSKVLWLVMSNIFFFLDCLLKNMMEVLTKKNRKRSFLWTGKRKPSVGFSHLACCYSRKSCGFGDNGRAVWHWASYFISLSLVSLPAEWWDRHSKFILVLMMHIINRNNYKILEPSFPFSLVLHLYPWWRERVPKHTLYPYGWSKYKLLKNMDTFYSALPSNVF